MSPLVWLIRSRTCIGRSGDWSSSVPPGPAIFVAPNAGIHFATGSTSWNLPSSKSVISAVQMIGLVIEYKR